MGWTVRPIYSPNLMGRGPARPGPSNFHRMRRGPARPISFAKFSARPDPAQRNFNILGPAGPDHQNLKGLVPARPGPAWTIDP